MHTNGIKVRLPHWPDNIYTLQANRNAHQENRDEVALPCVEKLGDAKFNLAPILTHSTAQKEIQLKLTS
jgi:hypothetical protein